MKKIIILLNFFITFSLFSVDFDTYFAMNNFHFNDDDEISSSSYDFDYGEIVTQEISDGLYLDAGFTKSIISDFSIFTDFRISNDLFGFNLGIFTNFLNDSSKIITPGLNYGLDFKIPGIILVNLELNNTIPNTSPLESGVSINNYNIKLGFYAGEAIISINLDSLSNTKGTILSSTSNIDNKYYLNLDLFNKYSKYRISIDLGWNSISRKIDILTNESDTLASETESDLEAGSVYFNSDFTLLFLENFEIDFGLLLHLIRLPINDVDAFESDEFSWGFNIGVVYKL
ncbi:MAG: hypothetical protein OCD02_11005 [Spirochaetaceae bacterium]